MLNYLWEDDEIFKVFCDVFLPAQLSDLLQTAPQKAQDLLDMVVTHLFVEPTLQVQDWRVVEISQRLIARQVQEASSISGLENDAILQAWFGQLTKSNEAKRAIHYMFKNKCEKIDIHYLTWHNMYSRYEKYLACQADPGAASRSSFDSTTSARLSANMGSRASVQGEDRSTDRLIEMRAYRELIKCLIDIADVITNMIFEKVNTIPYAIR